MMTSRIVRLFNGILTALVFVLLLTGCGAEDDQILGPAEEGTDVEPFAWLWAFDADQDSLRVYDVSTGILHATFFAQPHALLHEVQAGPVGEPTVWMGSGGTGFAFSAGFEAHTDHAHMTLPADLGTVTTGAGNTHLTTDPQGEFISWANDGDQTFTIVDAATRTPVLVDHGSPHSGSLVADGTVLATHMNEKWARMIDVDSGEIIATVDIDTLAHGEAFYQSEEQAFVPCLNGITVIGFQEQENLGLIAYPGEGRVNFLLTGHDASRALAPVKPAEGSAPRVWILDMAARNLIDVPLFGSALAWNRGGGNIGLSADGTSALLTDLERANAYLVNLAAGTAETLNVATADMACALDHSGLRMWFLDKNTGRVHFRYRHEENLEEGSGFSVHNGSDWIFITSLDPAVDIIRDY